MAVLIVAFQNCGGGFHSATKSTLSDPGEAEKAFSCNPAAEPAPTPLRRLNKSEYVNTVRSLLSKQSASDFSAIMNELNPLMATIPEDVDPKFSRVDSKIDQAHLSGYLFVAKKLGVLIAASDTRAKNFFGSCATAASMTAACLDQFFADMGKRIYRRPLTSDEITSLKANYNAFVSDKNAFLVARMLMSTHFLMHVETGGNEISPGLLEISPYELANRLSYQFLQNMPDDQLFAAAADGSIKTEAGLKAQIDRLLSAANLAQTRNTVAEFYRQWLGLYQLPSPENASGAAYAAFAGGASLSKASMIQEIEDMTSYYTFIQPGTFDDLLTSNFSFAKNNDLASIYGVAKWSGDPNALVSLPPGQRSGLLTRAALLANSTTATNPVARGVKIRRAFLCDSLPNPPASIANSVRVPEPDPNLSTRLRYEHKTSSALCMSCHSQINPLGFALENFDALGRFRTVEKVFNGSGEMVSEQPIDPVVTPAISYTDRRQSASPVEFNQLMAESGKARNCFVQQYFNFTYRQEPDLQADGCALEDMRKNLAGPDGSLKKMFMSVAQSRAFKLRKLASP